jgi:hypothetical protein
MKKLILLLLIIIAGMSASAMAVPTYSPTPADMYDLDHYKWYNWKINLTSQPGYTIGTTITEATLTFKNINNWQNENDDVLHIHLLNWDGSGSAGLTSGTDNQSPSDNFAGQGVLIAHWTDPDESVSENLVYTFSLLPDGRNILFGTNSLNSYASDGYIAFGIDPDCHYWNDGVEFKIYTSVIPAPGAILLGSIGVAFVGWLRRRRML